MAHPHNMYVYGNGNATLYLQEFYGGREERKIDKNKVRHSAQNNNNLENSKTNIK